MMSNNVETIIITIIALGLWAKVLTMAVELI